MFVVAVLAISWVQGSQLVKRDRRAVPSAPPDLAVTEVTLESEPGIMLRGWFTAGRRGGGAVLLVHGIRSNRAAMVARAEFLHRLGYAVLLFDLRAHGESTGDQITLGLREATDVETALRWLRTTAAGERIGIIGVSLGGAAVLLAHHPLPADAVVLESVFPRIESATETRLRMRIGGFAVVAKYLLLWQIPIRLHAPVSALHPVDHIADIGVPVLIISGTDDNHTTLAESEELCSAASQPKECWWVPDAAHVDLHLFAPAAYEERVGAFFAARLRP